MGGITVDTDAIRNEAKKWMGIADEMSKVRSNAQDLELGVSAFFIGNLTESVHYPAYSDFLERIVKRLRGGEDEFELIGIALRRIADNYDAGEVSQKASLDKLYSVTPQDVARVTEEPEDGQPR